MARRNTELENWAYAYMGAGCLSAIWRGIGPGGRLIVLLLIVAGVFFMCRDMRSEDRAERLAACHGYYVSEDWEPALKCYGPYISEMDAKGEGYLWRGYTLLASGETELALEDFNVVIEKEKYKDLGYEAIGDMWVTADPARAMNYYAYRLEAVEGKELQPEFASSFMGLARAFMEEGRTVDAVAAIAKALVIAGYFYPDTGAFESSEIGKIIPSHSPYRWKDILDWVGERIDTNEFVPDQEISEQLKFLQYVTKCDSITNGNTTGTADCYMEMVPLLARSSLTTVPMMYKSIVGECESMQYKNNNWEAIITGVCSNTNQPDFSQAVSKGTALSRDFQLLTANLLNNNPMIGIGIFMEPTGRVLRVLENSGAQNAGLQENDLIISVDGKLVSEGTGLTVGEGGTTMVLEIQRSDKKLSLNVTRDTNSYLNRRLSSIEERLDSILGEDTPRTRQYHELKGRLLLVEGQKMAAIDQFTLGIEMPPERESAYFIGNIRPIWSDFWALESDNSIPVFMWTRNSIEEAYATQAWHQTLKDLHRLRAETYESFGKAEEAKPDRQKLEDLNKKSTTLLADFQKRRSKEVSVESLCREQPYGCLADGS